MAAETSARRSLAIYLALIACLVAVKVIVDLASVEVITPGQATGFSWPMIGFLALAGGCSAWLVPRTGLPGVGDARVSPRRWLLLPAAVGLGLGAVNLAVQAVTGYVRLNPENSGNAGPSINVPFPESLAFYSGGAIVVESLFRLIPITLLLWLVGNVILRGRAQTPVFWVVAALASVIEPATTVGLFAGSPGLILVVGVGLYGVNLLEALLFRRYGFLAPLTFRLTFYLVWHGVGSAIGF